MMMQILNNRRLLNFAGFIICGGMMSFALYSQYGLELEPCPLCVFQRVAVITLGLFFLMAAIHNPGRVGAYVYAGLMGLTAAAGGAVAARHLWLQNLPPEKVPACGPDLNFMLEAFPLADVLQMVLSGSGECAEISWSLMGLSMPGWVLIALTSLGLAAIVINVRAYPTPET